MKTNRCKMKHSCCSVTFCPLVPSWATTIHKFQGFESGFDKNDQFQHLIVNPGDIKSAQQQPGILYVAMSCAKTIGDMTNGTPNPRNSAVYWTGSGMSKNRVLHGSTKKTNIYTRPRKGKLPKNCKEGQLGQVPDTAMQKHIIRTIQQEKTEENKEKN
jgi:hypothetical protein